jgi:signal transduction histidine kinase
MPPASDRSFSLDTPVGSRSIVRRAVTWFLGWSLLTLVILGIGIVIVANQLAKDAAFREARLRSTGFARTAAAPLVNATVRNGGPLQKAQLASRMRSRLNEGSIQHIKLWNSAGTIIWSDERNLAGKTFPLNGEVKSLFGTNHVRAEFSDLTAAENVDERGEGPLLEVYVGVRDANGVPFVFESYWSTGHLHADQIAITRRLVPLGLGALVLFELAVLPLALSLARRVDRIQAERSTVLRHALSAADRERRRIAQDLHDGLLQDLAGLGYALPSVLAQLPPGSEPVRRALTDAAGVVQRDMAALRSLLSDIYPADLVTGGLADAVADLTRRAAGSGVEVDVDVDAVSMELPLAVTQLSYQVIREGLRNVVKHAEATHAEVVARVDGPVIVVGVCDNGKGLDPGAPAVGHLGLRMLGDTLRDVGGHLQIEGRVGGGTCLTATFPLAAVLVSTG